MEEQAPTFPQEIGECIYCGSRAGKLGDEHVIPFGLGGKWILRHASCEVHEKLTSALEGDVLREAWGAARAALGIQTRHKKRRKAGFALKLEVGGSLKSVTLDASDHPAPIAWPVYSPPGIVPDKPNIPGTSVIRLRAGMRVARARELGAKHGATAVQFRYPEPRQFARFLAKVGYGFAVACNGLEATRRAAVLPALLSDSDDIYRFVGNVDTPTSFTGDTEQEVAMGRDESGRVVYVRLLGSMHAPEYVVRIDTPGTA